MNNNVTLSSADTSLRIITSLLEETSYASPEDSHKDDSPLATSIPPQIPYRIQQIFVGDKTVASILQKELIDTLHAPFYIELDNVFWPRDNRVILPDWSHLIPASLSNHSDVFHLLLPKESLHFINQPFDGLGLSIEWREQAISKAIELNLSYKKSQVCIEGGNCFVFLSPQGEKKAIIGYNTILLSMIRLERAHYFSNPSLPKRIFPRKDFSEDELRVARNYTLLATTKKTKPFQERLMIQANKLDWMFHCTIKQIAKAINIPSNRIAILGQESFHIDMEIFVGPKDPERPDHNFVFLHDEEKSLQIQNKIGFLNAPFFYRTKAHSLERLESSRQRLEKNIQILENIGCTPVRVPGLLTAQYLKTEWINFPYIRDHWMEKDCLLTTEPNDPVFINKYEPKDFEKFKNNDQVCIFNFMNGLFIKGNPDTFLVPSPRPHPIVERFQQAFREAVEEACPQLQVKFIYHDLLNDILLRHEGSLHCLTNYYQ